MIAVTAIVLTYNERKYIRGCLESIKWCYDIWVIDSGSTDGTLDICRQYTKNIVIRTFTNFYEMRNWALNNLPIRTEWILFIDADERVTPELREEIIKELSRQHLSIDGYYIPRKQYFFGQWLKHGEASPDYVLRLFRRGKGRYLDHEVHEPLVLLGKAGFLKNPIIHFSRSSMHEALAKLNLYTTLEAIRMHRKKEGLYPILPQDSVLKKLLKGIFERLPCKPLVKFFWDYIILQGFRDGYIGSVWASIQALYVFSAYFKLWALKQGIMDVETLQHMLNNREYTKLSKEFSCKQEA